MSKTKRQMARKTVRPAGWHLKWVISVLGVFVVLYVAVVGTRYDDILRMMEGNSWVDDHWLAFFRWPLVGALLMALPMAAAGGLVAALLWGCKRERWTYVSCLVPIALAYLFPPKANDLAGSYRLFSKEMNAEEQYYSYLRLTDEKEWARLLESLRQDGNLDTPIGMRYALLAENGLGRLPEVLFQYPVRLPEDLLFRGVREPLTCQFNRQFYDNLGLYDEAFHQAMEYGLFQPEGSCLYTLRQLADYALAEGDLKLAEKYLAVLETGWFNGSFVEERRETIRQKKLNNEADERPLRGDNFVGVYPFRSEMVRLAYYQVGDSQKALDYLLCSAMLEKNLQQFHSVLSQFPHYQQKALPRSYEEALMILQSGGRALRESPAGTYAYYYYNVTIPEGSDGMQMSSIN